MLLPFSAESADSGFESSRIQRRSGRNRGRSLIVERRRRAGAVIIAGPEVVAGGAAIRDERYGRVIRRDQTELQVTAQV